MGDLISRQAAIDALKNQMSDWNDLYNIPVRRSIVILEQLPSAQPDLQPTCNQLATDLISRQALCEYALNQKDKSVTPNDIMRFPSAQPDLDEWCTDCKEYDKEKHCCPRFNRVIRETLKDAEPERYTKEELKTFLHGISLRLLSLRSAQHWQEDEGRAKEIEFLAQLYEKVEADLKGKT